MTDHRDKLARMRESGGCSTVVEQSVVTCLTNADGETYSVSIVFDDDGTAGTFLMEMWKSVCDLNYPATPFEATKEWTDRGRMVRSTYSGGVARIRTHAWQPSDDKIKLAPEILKFLASKNIECM